MSGGAVHTLPFISIEQKHGSIWKLPARVLLLQIRQGVILAATYRLSGAIQALAMVRSDLHERYKSSSLTNAQ